MAKKKKKKGGIYSAAAAATVFRLDIIGRRCKSLVKYE